MQSPFKVIVVGAGLGGLSCAIACRESGLDVVVLERAVDILPVGAGIQVPPNAARVMQHFGLLDELEKAGALVMEHHTLRRYSTGEILAHRPWGRTNVKRFGAPHLVIHRAEYQKLLLDRAIELGVRLLKGHEVARLSSSMACSVELKNGSMMEADVIVGADGLWSLLREEVLGHKSEPTETGDLAYRGTFSAEYLKGLKDEKVDTLLTAKDCQVWIGPDRHVVFYPLRNMQQFNLVLARPDDLPQNARTAQGSVEEMRQSFEGWDPTLTTLISQLPSALKWKLCHHNELDTWIKDRVVLLGDACHPTLPYQAQGAAMAVEDGAVLGLLLGKLQNLQVGDDVLMDKRKPIPDLLKLYEVLRKSRTEVNVKGAGQMRTFFHLHDGPRQVERDAELSKMAHTEADTSSWNWVDATYQHNLLGFDAITNASEEFEKWVKNVVI